MPDVVKLREKVVRVCDLNAGNGRAAPHSRTELIDWLGIGAGSLSKAYSQPTANLKVSLERAIVMALGFGPTNSDFDKDPDLVWPRWLEKWGNSWRKDSDKEFAKRLEKSAYFVPRPRDDVKLGELLPRIRRKSNRELSQIQGIVPVGASVPAMRTEAKGRYLDRLASLQVVCRRDEAQRRHLYATCTFGTAKVETEDAAYLVAINLCHAELFLTEASFDPLLGDSSIVSNSTPVRSIKVRREFRSRNYPSWIIEDCQSKTSLTGEYYDVDLGVVDGKISGDDESSILVFKAGFVVSAMSGPKLGERGILSSLLKYMVIEFAGEIELRGSYRYYLSSRPIESDSPND
jgi:hypothetical protein